MTNHRAILKAIPAALLVCACGVAAAAGSTTLAVSATIIGTCKFVAASTPLAFGGAIDPSSGSTLSPTASVLYQCTKNTASLGITGVAGAHTMNTTPANTTPLSYTLAISGDTSPGQGFGAGTNLTATVTGTMTPAQFQNAIAGSYTDNVTLNITP